MESDQRRIIMELRDITKEYGQGHAKVRALRGLSATVAQDDYIAIMGPSGSGKSTLLCIMGLLHMPTEGSFILWGRDYKTVQRVEAARLRNREIGFVFQDSLLLPEITVLENVALPLYYTNVPRPQRRQRAMALLEELNLARLYDQPAKALSGGERQRVAIARALVNQPSLVLADEPTGSLDKDNGDRIMGMLDYLHHKGIAVVIVTHDPKVAARCRRTIFIRDGQIADALV
jgi:putative ABC transport system ATP-binding protein